MENRSPDAEARTLEDLVQNLTDRYRGLQSSPHTIARQRSSLKVFVEYLEEHHRVITPDALLLEHIHAFQSHLSQRLTKKTGMPLKPSTINSIIKAVRPYLDMLHECGYLRRPLAKHLKYIREPHLLPSSVLTHAQVRSLMRKIDTNTTAGIRDRAAVELLYSSGIRIGELESLRLQDVDIERGVARVVGKGKKERFVPIGKTALKWLTSYIRGVRPFQARLGDKPTDIVFLNAHGNAMSQHTLRDRVRDYGRQLNIDIRITPHTFRRSCTSEMIKSNANLYHVKQLLGHKSFETLNHYARLDIKDLRKTHERCHPRERDGQA